jgi:hypothetical protein
MNIFIVKSFGAFNGYTNLKAFNCELEAEAYAIEVKKQIPLDSLANGEEFVEVEELTLETV